MFDNSLPIDYPEFPPAEFGGDKILIVDDGDYIVDEYGHLMEITIGNKRYAKSDKYYDREINVNYFRAKYLGNDGDCLGYANQIRLANKQEVDKVKKWLSGGIKYKVMSNGQLSFI